MFLAESTIFPLILSNTIPEAIITAFFQNNNQDVDNNMNETKNNLVKKSKSANKSPYNRLRPEWGGEE